MFILFFVILYSVAFAQNTNDFFVDEDEVISVYDSRDGSALLRIVVNRNETSNNIETENITDNNTSTITYTFLVNPGDVIEFYWVAGSVSLGSFTVQTVAERAALFQSQIGQYFTEQEDIEQVVTEQIVTEHEIIEQADTEQIVTEHENIEQVVIVQYETELVAADHVDIEQFETEQVVIEVTAERTDAEQAVSGQEYTEQAIIEQTVTEQTVIGQTVIEQIAIEELIIEEPAITSTPEEQQLLTPVSVPAGFVHINRGTFLMGSPANEPGRHVREGPQRQVTIDSFHMGIFPVTQREYQEVMGTNPSILKGDNLPVETVSWFNAIEYCNRRSLLEGLIPAYIINGTHVTWDRNANGYRLPTEAEWEYACRAGTTTPFSTGNNITTNQANYNGNFPYNNNARGENRVRMTPVGTFAANPWGLFDMHGNVWEWCWDWFADYSITALDNPTGAASGDVRALRGGSWINYGQNLRSADRFGNNPSRGSENIGFRLVRSIQ